MKKYVLLLIAVLSAAISVTGLANSGPTVETTVKMFKPENQSLAREFLTVKEKSTKPNLVKLINNELSANVLFEEEHEGKKFVRIKDNVTKQQIDQIRDLAQSITDSATKENNMRAAVYSASLVDTANVKALDFKLKAK